MRDIKVIVCDVDADPEGFDAVSFDGIADLNDALVIAHEGLVFGAAMERPQTALVLYDGQPVLVATLNEDDTIHCRYYSPVLDDEMRALPREEDE